RQERGEPEHLAGERLGGGQAEVGDHHGERARLHDEHEHDRPGGQPPQLPSRRFGAPRRAVRVRQLLHARPLPVPRCLTARLVRRHRRVRRTAMTHRGGPRPRLRHAPSTIQPLPGVCSPPRRDPTGDPDDGGVPVRTTLRPARLAAYSAVSATWSNVRRSAPSAGADATPIETVSPELVSGPSGVGRSTRRLDSRLRMRSATASSSDGAPAGPASSTTNSSPPNRPTRSLSRTSARTAPATAASTWSPAMWPCVSLTALKWSRSSTRTPRGPSAGLLRCSSR